MKHARTEAPEASMYTPDVAMPDALPDEDAPPPWWRTLIRPSELVAVGVLASMLMSGLSIMGFRRESPSVAIAAESTARAKADTALGFGVKVNASRIDSLTRRVESLDDRLLFTNYLQCESARENHAALAQKAQADCDSIIQRRLAP